jgi:hypothetical protein
MMACYQDGTAPPDQFIDMVKIKLDQNNSLSVSKVNEISWVNKRLGKYFNFAHEKQFNNYERKHHPDHDQA